MDGKMRQVMNRLPLQSLDPAATFSSSPEVINNRTNLAKNQVDSRDMTLMMRGRIPAGRLSSEQYLVSDQFADQIILLDQSVATLFSRQTVFEQLQEISQ